MSQLSEWTATGSVNPRKGNYRPASCQGTGPAMVAPTCRFVCPVLPDRRRSRPPLCPRWCLLLYAALFARGRRTVTSWFRAAGITGDFRRAYHAMGAAGRQANALAYRLLD
jgi:hypothetical protein